VGMHSIPAESVIDTLLLKPAAKRGSVSGGRATQAGVCLRCSRRLPVFLVSRSLVAGRQSTQPAFGFADAWCIARHYQACTANRHVSRDAEVQTHSSTCCLMSACVGLHREMGVS